MPLNQISGANSRKQSVLSSPKSSLNKQDPQSENKATKEEIANLIMISYLESGKLTPFNLRCILIKYIDDNDNPM